MLFLLELMQITKLCKEKANKITLKVYNDLNELLECPISFVKIESPIILPSGNTVDKAIFRNLKGRRDPFNQVNFKKLKSEINFSFC